MRKEEFLQSLRRALNGDVPSRVIEENIRYYDNYITEEVRKGRTEEAVIDEIGDPRLIARTIEDTTDGAGKNQYEETYSYENSGRQSDYDRQPESFGAGGTFRYINLNKWYCDYLFDIRNYRRYLFASCTAVRPYPFDLDGGLDCKEFS